MTLSPVVVKSKQLKADPLERKARTTDTPDSRHLADRVRPRATFRTTG